MNNYQGGEGPKIKRAEKAETIVENLQPKTTILELKSDAFHPTNTSFNSVKESLENPIRLKGFYNPEKNTLISIEAHETQKKQILNNFIFLCVLIFTSIFTLYSLWKIIYNYRLKNQLVKDQIQLIHGSKRIDK